MSESIIDIEKANKIRVETLEKLCQLMKAAGYTDDEIRTKMNERLDCEKAASSFETHIKYIDEGKIEEIILNNSDLLKDKDMKGPWMKYIMDLQGRSGAWKENK